MRPKMTRSPWITALVLVTLGGSAFLLDRLGMKGVRWRIWAPRLEHRGDPIPVGAVGQFVLGGATPTAYQTFYGDGSSYTWAKKGGSGFILFRDGEATAAGYLARDAVAYYHAVRYPFGETFYAEAAPCGGEALFRDGMWTVRFTSPACSVANGTWDLYAPPAQVPKDDGGCTQYVACACDLAVVRPDIFAPTCEDARRLIGVARNDPESCRGGMAIARRLAAPLLIASPASCGER